MQHSIIKKELVRLSASGAAPAPARGPAARAARHQKAVQLVRVDGRVAALELTCSCGERSVVELEYPDANASKEAS